MKMNPRRTASALILLAALAAAGCACVKCRADPPRRIGDDAELVQLAEWLTGSFSSAAQAAADPDYRDIRLHMTPIWTWRNDAIWMYVEQAVAESPEAPYRQRIYRLTRGADGILLSTVYSLPEPDKFILAWRDVRLFGALGPGDLLLRDGCATELTFAQNRFVGGTVERECVSNLYGAAYATSEVLLTADRVESWDRGFDESDAQVWGAESGPYVFDRLDD